MEISIIFLQKLLKLKLTYVCSILHKKAKIKQKMEKIQKFGYYDILQS